MLEWIPLIIAGGALIPNTLPMNEKKRIIQVFENTDFCIKRPPDNEKKYPIFIRRTESETAKVYYFEMPLGLDLADHPKLPDRLCHSLNRQIEVRGESILEVWVYKISFPKEWHYKDIPEPPSKWSVPIGKTYKEMVWHDFDKIPHMTVAGMTQWGKTSFMKVVMTYLIERNPDDVEFYIVDLKRLEFPPFINLEQVKDVGTTIEEAHSTLKMVHQDIENDMNFFRSKRIRNIKRSPYKKRKFVIVDEGGEIPKNHDMQKILSTVARVAGALGYRLIFATQYPTGDTLPRQIKQNADAKVTFRLPTDTASQVAIDESGATELDRVGKAIYRTHSKQIVQVPYISDEEMEERLRRWEVDTTSEEVRETREDIIKFR